MLPSLAVSQPTSLVSPDSVFQNRAQPNPLLLPAWIPPSASPVDSAPDSLLLPVLPELRKTKPHSRVQRWLGVGLIAAGSALSYHYHNLAEDAYQEYVTSGNPMELDRLFARAERFDRLSGWSFVAAEAGLVLISLSVVFGP
jgi:hypothetical protein